MNVNETKGLTVLCFSQREIMVVVATSLPSDAKAEDVITLTIGLGILQQTRLEVDGYK